MTTTFDIDNADGCLGTFDSDDVIYWFVETRDDGFYVSTLIDSETGHSIEPSVTDDGPYLTWDKADKAGKDLAMEWCHTNHLEPDKD